LGKFRVGGSEKRKINEHWPKGRHQLKLFPGVNAGPLFQLDSILDMPSNFKKYPFTYLVSVVFNMIPIVKLNILKKSLFYMKLQPVMNTLNP